MKKHKNKNIIIIVVVILVFALCYTLINNKNMNEQEMKVFAEAVQPSTATYFKRVEEVLEKSGQKYTPEQKVEAAIDIYKGLNSTAENIYHYGKEVFGQGPVAEAASNWIALTLMPESSPTYTAMFKHSIDQVNQRPSVVLDAIDAKADLIQQEPFFHQMVINMVHLLNIPRATKLKYFAKQLQRPIEFDEEGLTPTAANVYLAMDFLNTYNATADEMKDSLTLAKHNYRNLNNYYEFKMRMMTFFPGTEEYL